MQDVVQKIIEIMTDDFPNGIRDDFIDTSKALRIYSAIHANENISRSFITEVICANGVEGGGRFYFISDVDATAIKNFFDELWETNSIIYYAAAYERHSTFLARMHIFSPEVLKKILQKVDANHFYFEEFCSANRTTSLRYEVSKVFMATEGSLSLEELQDNLPYVPPEKISAVLATKRYLSTSAGKYVAFSKIQFDAEEIQDAKQQITACIAANGQATSEDYDLSSNFALNPELAEKDLRNVIYEKFFVEDFTKRGKKLFKKGDDLNASEGAVSRIREFVATQIELPVEKLFAFSKRYDPAPSTALSVAYESMVRVDKNLFVKDALINFDVAGVDEALAAFVQDKIISLRAVTSFTGFPPVAGYSWNLFLLESFLRKFSRRYVYATPSANSANVGAIHPKSMTFKDYLDVQAAAVLQERVPFNKSAVEEFLISRGYRAKRIDKVTARVIIRAQEIFNGRR